MPRELIITNGDSAANNLRNAGLCAGEGNLIMPWRDVLFEGPVPHTLSLPALSNVRATYLTGRGWGAGRDNRIEFAERDAVLMNHAVFDVVTLWFEHDLSDMLQLLQILDFFAGEKRDRTSLRLVHTDRYLTKFGPDELRAMAADAKPVGTARINQATEAWARWREPDPRPWLALAHRPRLEIKHLWRAVTVSDGTFPLLNSGVSLPERFLLDDLEDGPRRPAQLFTSFTRWHDTHCGAYMGDWSFWSVIDDLAFASEPLVTRAVPYRFGPHMDGPALQRYLQEPIALTDFGRDVLAGDADHAETNRIDRWLGGTHITNDALWRWDNHNHRVIPPR